MVTEALREPPMRLLRKENTMKHCEDTLAHEGTMPQATYLLREGDHEFYACTGCMTDLTTDKWLKVGIVLELTPQFSSEDF